MTALAEQINRNSTIAAAVFLGMLGGTSLNVIPLIVSAVSQDMGLTDQQSGFVAAAEMAGVAIASLLAPLWIGKFNRRVIAAIAVSIMIIGNLITLQIDSISAYLPLRILTSLGNGTIFTVVMALIADTNNPHKGFGFLNAAQSAWAVTGFAVLPALIGNYGSAIIFSVLIVVAIIGLALTRILPSTGLPREVGPSNAGGSLLPAILALLALCLFNANIGSVWSFMVPLGGTAELSVQQVGGFVAIATICSIAGSLIAGAIARKIKAQYAFLTTLVCQLIALFVLYGDFSGTLFGVMAALYAAFWGFTLTFMFGLVAQKDSTGRMTVLMPAVQMAGFAGGPFIAALFLTGAGFQPVIMVGGITLVLGILSALVSGGMGQKPEAA